MLEHILTFELAEDESLHVRGDEAGLLFLRDMLSSLVEDTKPGHFEHVHLMTTEWGGHELSSETWGGRLLNHVKIYCVKGPKMQWEGVGRKFPIG
jgi:hypothetical protein